MAELHELIEKIENPELRAQIQAAADRLTKQKKFGLVFEEHLPECTPLYDIPVRKGAKVSVRNGKANETYTVLKIENGMATCMPKNSKEAVQFAVTDLVTTAELGDPIYPCLQPLGEVCNAPDSELWHTLIEADNYHALQLLEYLYAGKVDCIYIDPPYNTGARDWKYNNDYVDGNDTYRHSKWLSMIEKRLKLAKHLLNPVDSVMIVTIDEKEYLHLGCLLEELFPEARIQMVSDTINSAGVNRGAEFSRSNEFIYFVKLGASAPAALPLSDEWRGNTKAQKKDKLVWNQLMRAGTNARRIDRPNLFYPLFVSEDGLRIVSVGESIDIDVDRNSVVALPGTVVIWPIRSNGEEGNWQISQSKLLEIIKKGYVRLGSFTSKGMAITYLKSGEQKKVEDGTYTIIGHRQDGSVIEAEANLERLFVPGTSWNIQSHNATYFGSQLLNKYWKSARFTFPKSLYAEHDAIRFFVANKPDALIIDFFAGSGTTLHAVNLLNAEDGGHRRCIMVTNNEISAEERKGFEARGIKQGDPEWEARGIARYVTWPRTVCSIEGHDVNGNPLKGNYIGSDIPMADGFKANAVFFKLGFLDKTKVSLGMQFKELISTLWMKAGAIGKCPVIDASVPDMLILPENKMAILNDENQFGEFAEQLTQHPEIDVVYLVTDYESSFVSMTQALDGKTTYQLYKDYLDNFRINAGRNSR